MLDIHTMVNISQNIKVRNYKPRLSWSSDLFWIPCTFRESQRGQNWLVSITLCRGKAIQSYFRILSRGVLQHVWCSLMRYRKPIKGWLCRRVPFTSYWRSLSASLSKITILHSAGCAFLRASFVCHCASEVGANPLSTQVKEILAKALNSTYPLPTHLLTHHHLPTHNPPTHLPKLLTSAQDLGLMTPSHT